MTDIKKLIEMRNRLQANLIDLDKTIDWLNKEIETATFVQERIAEAKREVLANDELCKFNWQDKEL